MYALTHMVWAIATPEPGPFFERMANLGTASEFSIFADVEGHRLEAALLASSAAVQEELVYRCAWLGAIAHATRRVLSRTASRVAAVSLSSLAWAFVHAGMVEPEWAKLLQVSVLGLVLGLLALRRGAGAAVAAHVCFNLIAVLFLA